MPIRQPVRTALSAALLVGVALVSQPAAAATGPYSSLLVIGDSLSDNGNLSALLGGAFPPAPYFQGRFSNGPVAAEVLASGLGLSGSQFVDLAIAGAQSGPFGEIGVPGQLPLTGMLVQLSNYAVSLNGASADSNGLYMVWGGANDLRRGDYSDSFATEVTIRTVVNNLTSVVYTLHQLGARNFLLPNLPDLGLTPEAREAGISAESSFISALFNQKLFQAYGALAANWTDEHFYYYDAMGAQQSLTAGAPGNGYTNVTQGCISTPGCNPNTFLYWDQIHPTAAAHQIIGAGMLAAVTAVPEPQSLLLMATGVLAVLALGRRRA